MLGSRPGYLLQTLQEHAPSSAEGERWRLLVLEDSGELLAADARAATGQGLSRLLNVTDGLLGAGLRALVLVTTNEPIGRMHPAVVRAGRAWAEIEFGRLAADEATAWLRERGVDDAATVPVALSDLFALAAGRAARSAAHAVGFA